MRLTRSATVIIGNCIIGNVVRLMKWWRRQCFTDSRSQSEEINNCFSTAMSSANRTPRIDIKINPDKKKYFLCYVGHGVDGTFIYRRVCVNLCKRVMTSLHVMRHISFSHRTQLTWFKILFIGLLYFQCIFTGCNCIRVCNVRVAISSVPTLGP